MKTQISEFLKGSMKRGISSYRFARNPFRKGVTLVEILMALVILALAILPVIGTFSKYYGVASRQMEQEIALKIGEAAMNKLMSHKYSDLAKAANFSLPLNFQIPSGAFAGSLVFAGGTGKSAPIKIGKSSYVVSAVVDKVFIAQNLSIQHSNALEFKYALDPIELPPPDTLPPGPPPLALVATYSCFDDLVSIKLRVNYGGPKDSVELSTFRADMTK